MAYCEPAGLGWVFPADAGYQCFPDAPNKVRKPDASFIRRERLPEGPHARGFTRIAPDLAVEVLSPHEYATDVETKLQEYLDAGVQLVWKVNPEARLVTVLRVDGTGNRLREDDELSGENIIPFLPLSQPASE
jgi:Uma2 family endonuclease